MKKIFITVLFVFTFITSAYATIGPMNYQGRLLDDNGVPVTGSYNFRVRVYDAATNGSVQFQELHSGVSVNDGVYSFLVSTGVNETGAWDIALWNQSELYLELEVNGETLSPRTRIAAAPYAFQANLALTTNDALALGGRSADDYDNILADICASSKGKWLDNIEVCLGVAAVVTNENAATMASDLDYTFLDLSFADMTGTAFDGANFTRTLFKNTAISAGSITNANFTWATLDGVTSNTTLTATAINLSHATLKNMDLTGWDLSNATMTNLSAAELTGCPAALPTDWSCKEQRSGSSRYILVGPGGNFSANSAATETRWGAPHLNVDGDVFNGENISGATFEGNTMTLNLLEVDASSANFTYTTIFNTAFTGVDLTNTDFSYSNLREVTFIDYFIGEILQTATVLNNTVYHSSVIDGATFFVGATGLDLSSARIKNMQTGSYVFDAPIYNNAVFENLLYYVDHDNESASWDFDGVTFYGDALINPANWYHECVNPIIELYCYLRMHETIFVGGNVRGDFTNFVFQDVSWRGSDLKGADFTGATFYYTPYGSSGFNGVSWAGATCPDGTAIALDDNSSTCSISWQPAP